MKKFTLIIIAAMVAATLSSCGTAGHLASGYDKEEMRNVMLFEPVSKIETIGKGNISVTNDTACLASQELLLQTLMTYDTGMNINSTYTSGEDEEIRKGIEYLYAQYLNTGYGHDSMSFVVPESLDSIIEKLWFFPHRRQLCSRDSEGSGTGYSHFGDSLYRTI